MGSVVEPCTVFCTWQNEQSIPIPTPGANNPLANSLLATVRNAFGLPNTCFSPWLHSLTCNVLLALINSPLDAIQAEPFSSSSSRKNLNKSQGKAFPQQRHSEHNRKMETSPGRLFGVNISTCLFCCSLDICLIFLCSSSWY